MNVAGNGDAPEDEEDDGLARGGLEVGFWVALTVSQQTALPFRTFVGEIAAVDPWGVRIAQVQWTTGSANQLDVFVPWKHIDGALVATEKHSLAGFLDQAREWAARALINNVADTTEVGLDGETGEAPEETAAGG